MNSNIKLEGINRPGYTRAKRVGSIFILLSVALISVATYATPKLGVDPLDDVVKALTLEEKAKFVRGVGMSIGPNGPVVGQFAARVPGAAGSTHAIPRLGIPSMVLADGPAGLRINPLRDGMEDKSYYATAFPIASLLASTWDVSLVETVGEAIGTEAKEYGVDVLLAPALNVHRFALGGRNFEYYSEDPLIGGKIAAAMVKGVQSKGVGTSLKHFVANNHEWNRNTIDVKMDERTFREIYLRGFEIAVKESQPWTIMSSYNKVNGEYASESARLLTQILRKEWGFDGLVMTDWLGGVDAIKQMHAGNDLLMPGMDQQEAEILEGLKNGKLDEKMLDRNIKAILGIILKSPTFKGYRYSDAPDLKQNAAIAKAAAVEGMVLLKNDNNVLPLNAHKKLAVFGNSSYNMVTGGTGSGDVNEAYIVSLEEGLVNSGIATEAKLAKAYKDHITEEEARRPVSTHPFAAYMPKKPLNELELDPERLKGVVNNYDAALFTIGRRSGEFVDREKDDFYLTDKELKMLSMVSQLFREKGKPVVVILNVGGVIETQSWQDKADAILLAFQPGQEAGSAIADILLGKVNPSGKLTDTWPVALEDYPAAQGFPGKVLDPNSKPEGIMQTQPSEVDYDDGIWLGYRHFNSKNIDVAYPFGFGLSYTRFVYDDINISSKKFGDRITVNVRVENTGTVAGKEVVQLYVSAPEKNLVKPDEELRGFAKTALLQPGESEVVSFTLSPRDLASFDEEKNAWVVAPGKYLVKAGASSRDLRQRIKFKVKEKLELPL